MINDLVVDALTWKYVDDTAIAQTIPRGLTGDVQSAVSAVEAWSIENRMELNAEKCREMRIDFKKGTFTIFHQLCDKWQGTISIKQCKNLRSHY